MPGSDSLSYGMTVLYVPVVIALFILWYQVIDLLMQGVRKKRKPLLFGWPVLRAIIGLPVLMLLTRPIWARSLPEILTLALTYWLLTHGRRDLANLTPPLRLKLCTLRSIILLGIGASFVVATGFYLFGLFGNVFSQSAFYVVILLLKVGAFGAICGLLRWSIRRRWPHAIQTTHVSRFGVTSGGGFYVDELLLPILLTPILGIGLSNINHIWKGIFLFGGVVFPSFVLYALWAWFHSGFIAWLGEIPRDKLMLFNAYEVLLKYDHIQPWLGEISISAKPDERTYVVSGTLPDRATLLSLRTRLEDIDEGVSVDASSVVIDPQMRPDPRRLTAIERRGTASMRRKTATTRNKVSSGA